MKKLFLILTLLCSNAFANVTDLKIGVAQIFGGAYWGFGSYEITQRYYPTMSNGATSKMYGKTELDAMKAAGQYFQLVQPTYGVNDYAMRIMNSNGTPGGYVSYSGQIVGMADGLIHYKSNNSVDVFIFPNNGYSIGAVAPGTSDGSYNNKFTPTTAQLLAYMPPSSTPIQTPLTSVPLGTGIAGGAAAPVYVSDMTTTQSNQLTATRTRLTATTTGNKIYLEEKTGTSGSIVNIEQSGNYNTIQGVGTSNATINGTTNTIGIKQGSVLGKNMIEFSVKGISNKLNVWESRNVTDGSTVATDSGGHYSSITIDGNLNEVTTKQANTGGTSSGHFEVISVIGSSNKVSLKQTDNSDKKFWGSINGNSNNVTVIQEGVANHFLDLSLTGYGNTANITQKGTASHKATINLTNSSGPNTMNLTQQGSTAQIYNLTQSCAVTSGCSVTLVQGQ